MKKKTIVKIALDSLMLIVIALMYSKRALGMTFHEVGGLALIGAFFIHQGLNFGWITHVTKKLGRADGKTRLMWMIDALMLLSFLLVGVSGLAISKVVLPSLFGQVGGAWQTAHYTSAALSLILVGAHLGLHARFLFGIAGKWIRLPRALAVALTCALLAYGAYSAATTSFARWLTMPFTSGAEGGQGRGADYARAATMAEGELATPGEAKSTEGDSATSEGAAQTSMGDAASPDGTNGAGFDAQGERGQPGAASSPLIALKTFAQFFSISFLFAAITAGIGRLTFERRKRRPVPAA